MTKCLTMIALIAFSSTVFAGELGTPQVREPRHEVICTPTLNLVEQAPFLVQRVAAQSDISNLEEMTQSFSYGNIYFKVAIDTQGNYRIRCNLRSPYTELLIAQGRMPGSDRLFIDFSGPTSNSSARIRLECVERPEAR
jgi:hypothetical protein